MNFRQYGLEYFDEYHQIPVDVVLQNGEPLYDDERSQEKRIRRIFNDTEIEIKYKMKTVQYWKSGTRRLLLLGYV